MTEILLENILLECPVCLEVFDDTCKMLPCQHTFHEKCLQKIYNVEERLECPMCRLLVSQDIEHLPRNYFLQRLLEQKQKSNADESKSPSLQYTNKASEIKARAEYLQAQKEKLEHELMLLKSEREPQDKCTLESPTSLSIAFSADSGSKENNCSISPCHSEQSNEFFDCFNSLEIESSIKNDESSLERSELDIVKQVTDDFESLKISETHSSLTEKLMEIVKIIYVSSPNLNDVDVMHLIDYYDLIEGYLSILSEMRNKNDVKSFSEIPAEPTNATTQSIPFIFSNSDCNAFIDNSVNASNSVLSNSSCAINADHTSLASSSTNQNTVFTPVARVPVHKSSSNFNASVPLCDSDLSQYDTYALDDDDQKLNYALKLSLQMQQRNIDSNEVMEKVLENSKTIYTIDQQINLFLGIREKVELQIALLLSEI